MVFLGLVFLLSEWLLLELHPPTEWEDTVRSGQVCIAGILADKQFKNDSYVLTISQVREVTDTSPDGISKNKQGEYSILAYLDSVGDLPSIGAPVLLKGKRADFEEARNPGQFDFRQYYRIRGIRYRLYEAVILRVGEGCHVLREKLWQIRRKIAGVFEKTLPEKDAGILKAMVLGDKTSLSPEVKGLYQRSGISHALSISGLHISILGYGLYRLLRRLFCPRGLSGAICSVFLILYSTMVGNGTSTLRAVIMFAVCMGADLAGRTYDMQSALCLALILILITEPLYIYDSGFLLSFGAVEGIGLVKPYLEKCFSIGGGKTISSLLISASISIFTLPVTLYFFFQIPIYSIFLNLLLIPLMGALVISAIFLAVLGAILPILALPFGIPCRVILFLYERGCYLCESLPNALYITGRPDLNTIVLYYLVLMGLISLTALSKKRKKHVLLSIKNRELKVKTHVFCIANAAILIALFFILTHQSISGIQITMLDIGQGDCNIIQNDNGKVYIIDCGSTTEKGIAEYRLIPYLKYCGIDRIDCAFMTHSDTDHISGFQELLSMEGTEGISIGNFFLPDIGQADDNYLQFQKEIRDKGIPIQKISAGDCWEDGKLSLTCIHPGKGYIAEDPNSYSTVLQLRYGELTGLFTGDVQGEGEELMMEKIEKGSHFSFLKVAHHGSKNSTPKEFLDLTRPDLALISCGKDNSYGHPHRELLQRLTDRGCRILMTPKTGAILLSSNGEYLKVKSFLSQNRRVL